MFNANQLRPYSARRTLLDSVDPLDTDQDPDTAEEMAVKMGHLGHDDALNHPSQQNNCPRCFEVSFGRSVSWVRDFGC